MNENEKQILDHAISFLDDYMELLNTLERHGTEDDVYKLIQDLKEWNESK